MFKDKAKSFLNLYQRAFWYIAQAKQELLKPLGLWNETILILTFLSVKGYDIGLSETLIGYVIILLILALVGKIITALGIVSYNMSISNKQNPELNTILRKIDELSEKIK